MKTTPGEFACIACAGQTAGLHTQFGERYRERDTYEVLATERRQFLFLFILKGTGFKATSMEMDVQPFNMVLRSSSVDAGNPT